MDAASVKVLAYICRPMEIGRQILIWPGGMSESRKMARLLSSRTRLAAWELEYG